MGFNMNDIVSFMVSDAVSLVNEISSANMFDEYMFKTTVNDAVKILQGYFPLSNFFYGKIKKSQNSEDYDDYDNEDRGKNTGEVLDEAYKVIRHSF